MYLRLVEFDTMIYGAIRTVISTSIVCYFDVVMCHRWREHRHCHRRRRRRHFHRFHLIRCPDLTFHCMPNSPWSAVMVEYYLTTHSICDDRCQLLCYCCSSCDDDSEWLDSNATMLAVSCRWGKIANLTWINCNSPNPDWTNAACDGDDDDEHCKMLMRPPPNPNPKYCSVQHRLTMVLHSKIDYSDDDVKGNLNTRPVVSMDMLNSMHASVTSTSWHTAEIPCWQCFDTYQFFIRLLFDRILFLFFF